MEDRGILDEEDEQTCQHSSKDRSTGSKDKGQRIKNKNQGKGISKYL